MVVIEVIGSVVIAVVVVEIVFVVGVRERASRNSDINWEVSGFSAKNFLKSPVVVEIVVIGEQ